VLAHGHTHPDIGRPAAGDHRPDDVILVWDTEIAMQGTEPGQRGRVSPALTGRAGRGAARRPVDDDVVRRP